MSIRNKKNKVNRRIPKEEKTDIRGYWKKGVQVLAVGVLMGSVWLVHQMSQQVYFPVTSVQLLGLGDYVAEEEVMTVISPLLKQGLFGIDLDLVQTGIEQHDWVAVAQARRKWPSTLIIKLAQHQPVARWRETRLVNAIGQLFAEIPDEQFLDLPVLQGPENKVEQLLEMEKVISQSLQSRGLEIKVLSLDRRGSWQMSLRNGPEVRLGKRNPVDKVDRLVRVGWLALKESWSDIASIDLRYSNGFAVMPLPASTVNRNVQKG